jgi:hypothetical protein
VVHLNQLNKHQYGHGYIMYIIDEISTPHMVSWIIAIAVSSDYRSESNYESWLI